MKIPAFNIVPLPDAIDDEMGAILDPLGNAVHTALAFDIVGEDVLVTGAGPIGIMGAAVARHVGARHVVITDMNPERLKLAAEVADVVPVNITTQNLREVMDRLGMKEGFDVGLEMSGAPVGARPDDRSPGDGRPRRAARRAGAALHLRSRQDRLPHDHAARHLRPRDVRDLAQDAGHARDPASTCARSSPAA